MQLIQSVLFRLMQTEKYLKKDSKLIGALAMQKIDIEKSFSHKVCFFYVETLSLGLKIYLVLCSKLKCPKFR